MIQLQSVTDIPSWVNEEYHYPEWEKRIVDYYKESFVVPKKSFDDFLDELNNTFVFEELKTEDRIYRISSGEYALVDKVWVVTRDDNSEFYYQKCIDSRFIPFERNHALLSNKLLMFYRQDIDRFESNSKLLRYKMTVARGIDQKDIDEWSPDYVEYFLSCLGYNLELDHINRSLERKKKFFLDNNIEEPEE